MRRTGVAGASSFSDCREYASIFRRSLQVGDTKYQIPSKAIEAGIEGKVYVNFIIDSTGRVGHAEIQRNTQSLLNAEALKGIEAMPDWIPGKQRGKAVRVIYTLPVTFSLKDQAGNFAPKVTIIPPHNEAKTPTLVKDSSETENSTEVCIFQVVEEMPEFAEGNVAEWIMKNIKYPKEAIEANITGKVFVQFVIEKTEALQMLRSPEVHLLCWMQKLYEL